MNERIRSLYQSLVGSSTEFSFKNKVSSVTTIENNIKVARERIERDVDSALSVGGKLCVMLLAELTSYYRNTVYYMAVRSSIRMRRYRPLVLEYLKLTVEERSKRLADVLSENVYRDRNRDLKVTIAGYFLGLYTRRINEFKPLLTHEEFFMIASKRM